MKSMVVLFIVVNSASCVRFSEYLCDEICFPDSTALVRSQSSLQCARHCLENKNCLQFLYHDQQELCLVNGELCCSGWRLYYTGSVLPEFNKTSVLSITTPGNYLNPYYSLTSYGITGSDRTFLIVDVKGCRDAHIGLSKIDMDSSNPVASYEIVIGGSNNTWTYLRRNEDYKAGGHGIVDCGNYVTFWVTWDNDVIRIGHGKELRLHEILSWTDPGFALNVKYIGLGTYAFDIEWRIYL